MFRLQTLTLDIAVGLYPLLIIMLSYYIILIDLHDGSLEAISLHFWSVQKKLGYQNFAY